MQLADDRAKGPKMGRPKMRQQKWMKCFLEKLLAGGFSPYYPLFKHVSTLRHLKKTRSTGGPRSEPVVPAVVGWW